jgi:hypothetical protein
MIDKTIIDKIYIAGYIDGDGCFDIRTNTSKTNSKIDIASVNLDILIYFAKVFGGNVQISKKGKTAKQKPCHHWVIHGKDSCKFAINILPYLIEKRSQCQTYIDVIQSKLSDRTKFKEIFFHTKSHLELVTKQTFEELRLVEKSIEPTEEDFIYLAGFIDAECSLGIQNYKPANRPNKVYKISLQLNNSVSPVFFWIRERFGGHVHFIDRKSKDITRRDQICWRISGKSLYPILKQLRPFLHHKQPVCDKLIEFHETILPNGGARHTQAFRDAYSAVLAKRECILHDVHKLNLKGVSI